MKYFHFLFFLFTISLSAQIKGVVKDSITGKPIPYVNIWVQNENIGSTTEENGEFTINTSDKNKKIIFSALGFEKKTIKASEAVLVYLQPVEYQLEEVFISKRIESKQIEIGKTKNSTYQAFENGPRIDTKFFPYLEHYKKTKYIKKVSIFIDNKLDDASVKIHFYKVDKNGFPEEELLKKDFIVSVKSGVKKHLINVSDFNLTMPKNGIFVGFEKLIIEKNKLEKTIFDPNSNTTKITTTYFPLLLYNRVEREFLFSFSGGKWNKNPNNTSDSKKKMSVNEPAITLILTN